MPGAMQDLVIRLAAETRQFDTAMARAQRKVEELAGSVNKSAGGWHDYYDWTDKIFRKDVTEKARTSIQFLGQHTDYLGRSMETMERSASGAMLAIRPAAVREAAMGMNAAGVAAGGLASQLAMVAAGAISFVVVKRAISGVVSETERITRAGRFAQWLDIPVQQLTALEYAAERNLVDVEALQSGVQYMQRTIADAATGQGAAVKQFDKLGLSTRNLMQLRAHEQFLQIAEAVSRLNTPMEQVAATTRIFGKNSWEMVYILRQGRKAIEDLEKQGERTGNVLTEKMATSAEQATKGFRGLWLEIKTVRQELALFAGGPLGLAAEGAALPVRGAAGLFRQMRGPDESALAEMGIETDQRFTKAREQREARNREVWGRANREAEQQAQERFDFLNKLRPIAEGAGFAGGREIGGQEIMDRVRQIQQVFEWSKLLAPSFQQAESAVLHFGATANLLQTWQDVIRTSGDALQGYYRRCADIQELLSVGAIGVDQAGRAFRAAFDSFDSAAGGINKRLEDMRWEISAITTGAESWKKELWELSKNPLVTPEQLQELERLHGLQDDLRAEEEIRKKIATPEEIHGKEEQRIRDLFERGRLTRGEMERALAVSDGEAVPGKGERGRDRFAGALERNTREAYSAILAAMGRGDPQKKIEDNTKRAADGIERVAGGIERIERKGADVVPIGA